MQTNRARQGGPGLHLARVVVGAAIAFAVMSLLYGLNNAITIVVFAIICTIGFSLFLIIPGCWLIGWVVFAAWDAIVGQRTVPKAP
jgi:hypothetical protein